MQIIILWYGFHVNAVGKNTPLPIDGISAISADTVYVQFACQNTAVNTVAAASNAANALSDT